MSDAENPSSPKSDAPGVTNSRRRILRVGAGSAPIILTLLSRPVLGVNCSTASAVGSTLHSSHSPQISSCSGLSVSTWTAASTQWPNPYTKNGANATPYRLDSGCQLRATQVAVTRPMPESEEVLALLQQRLSRRG